MSEELPDEDGVKTIMSDSGVCLEKNPEPTPQASTTLSSSTMNGVGILLRDENSLGVKHGIFDGDNLSTNSSQNLYEHVLHSQIDKLRESIATKKAEIMKILELGGEKSQLDEMIDELQELQKHYVKLEMRLENSRGKSGLIFNFSPRNSIFCTDGCVSDGEMSTDLRETNGSCADSDESARHNPLMMSTISTRNNSITASSVFSHPSMMTRSLPTIEGSLAIRE
jgi:kinesin family protein 16B